MEICMETTKPFFMSNAGQNDCEQYAIQKNHLNGIDFSFLFQIHFCLLSFQSL